MILNVSAVEHEQNTITSCRFIIHPPHDHQAEIAQTVR